jgi:folate-binding protein YgfZ
MKYWIPLPSRCVLSLSGPEARSFLQGLVTQDLNQPGPLFSAMLTRKGRFLADFFIISQERKGKELLFLDMDLKHVPDVTAFFKELMPLHEVECKKEDLDVFSIFCTSLNPQALKLECTGIVIPDPRSSAMGWRALLNQAQIDGIPEASFVLKKEETYHDERLKHVLAEGAYDLVAHQSIILEYGYEEQHAISWKKGCYVGQELMARTYYRGEVRKHPYGMLCLSGSFPMVGTELKNNEEKWGHMGGHCGALGLASLYDAKVESMTMEEPIRLHWNCEGEEKTMTVRLFPRAKDLSKNGLEV